MVHKITPAVDGVNQGVFIPDGIFVIQRLDIMRFRDACCGVPVFVVGAHQEVQVVGSPGIGAVIKIFTCQQGIAQLALYGLVLIHYGFIEHGCQFGGVAERHPAYG